ncbi:MOSC domain-containing protein [Metabacillus litoralis]|uniref:MOSC domain-containing protein n=1 Tax=Metabacillus TaxID=2675233 RepID=UPI001BA2C27D|nr:MOSC domain-containing protein [Metabacillus litoralis]MCM3160120.1 MOSC domain-containing protein [Metabacillus litoralis]UHA59633.1 MOSC domain-containing protein [Metabacillus litoralis]
MDQKIIWLSKGKPSTLEHKGKEFRSGICKSQVETLEVKSSHIVDDDVANHEYHGGAERVICVYPFEHYEIWENLYKQPLPKAAFGENLTVSGMKETDVCIGDIYQIGEAVVQVSQGRFPCSTINKYTNINTLLNKIVEHGYTGYFFRVLEEGQISSNSSIKRLKKHPKEISVAAIHNTFFHHKDDLPQVEKILSLSELSEEWHVRMKKLRRQLMKK